MAVLKVNGLRRAGLASMQTRTQPCLLGAPVCEQCHVTVGRLLEFCAHPDVRRVFFPAVRNFSGTECTCLLSRLKTSLICSSSVRYFLVVNLTTPSETAAEGKGCRFLCALRCPCALREQRRATQTSERIRKICVILQKSPVCVSL